MKKASKRIISLILVATMVISTVAFSIVSTSAATNEVQYTISVRSAYKNGLSDDIMKLKLNGENGSTGWITGSFGVSRSLRDTFTYNDIGKIQSITAKNIGCNGWYPEVFTIKKSIGGKEVEKTNIYACGWVDDSKETTFKVNRNVYKLDIHTADKLGAGTNCDVHVTLHSANGKKSQEINATSLSPATDAFEQDDQMSLYVTVPDDFDKLNKVEFRLDMETGYFISSIVFVFGVGDLFNSDWTLGSVTATKVSGPNDAKSSYSSGDINKTINSSSSQFVTFN